jgi:hypothetical protein
LTIYDWRENDEKIEKEKEERRRQNPKLKLFLRNYKIYSYVHIIWNILEIICIFCLLLNKGIIDKLYNFIV